ncbi:MAG: hypothetical protein ACI9EW_001620 [Cellvibrionaceae bacterium]|jgi:hypothetical protein
MSVGKLQPSALEQNEKILILLKLEKEWMRQTAEAMNTPAVNPRIIS